MVKNKTQEKYITEFDLFTVLRLKLVVRVIGLVECLCLVLVTLTFKLRKLIAYMYFDKRYW